MKSRRLRSALVIGFTLGLVGQFANADNRERFEARTFESPNGDKLLYRLLRPRNYNKDSAYPLVLFFHGAGERGDDNFKQLVHGMRDFASDEIMEKHPCFVIAPQCPNGKQWVDTPWSAESHEMPEQTPQMRMSLELVGALQKQFSIDAKRLYATGLSMGGFGTWDAIQRYPKVFAAAVAICGGGDSRPEKVKPIAQLPIWVFHGGKDTVVKTKRSRDMISALKKAGGNPKYTEYPKTGHNSWARAYSDRELFTWLFAQKR
ncbi:MAG: prolyl oligopeptidase family serine peptidase [Planctomycetes bacterium]|nr:prolyl oligopeptidase family serine peptidase [Planctomycetota bacterium]